MSIKEKLKEKLSGSENAVKEKWNQMQANRREQGEFRRQMELKAKEKSRKAYEQGYIKAKTKGARQQGFQAGQRPTGIKGFLGHGANQKFIDNFFGTNSANTEQKIGGLFGYNPATKQALAKKKGKSFNDRLWE
jgi:hypothetical protein